MRWNSTALSGICLVLAACGGGSGSTSEPAATLAITIPTSPIPSGTSVQASATITNSSGSSPASNVTWSTSDATTASISTDGLITGKLAGVARITATSGTITGFLNVTVVPGEPAKVVIYTGDGQSAQRGSTLADPLCTNVLDAAGNKILGVTVTYSVATGGGRLGNPTAPQTNPSGIAISGLWTLGASPGAQTVVASAAGATSVTFTATAQ